MGKSKLQISLPEDPFYDLRETSTPAKTGGYSRASPKMLRTPKSSRSKERRLECLQWALDQAQEQQVTLLGGMRTQLDSARAQVAHLESQVGQLAGQLAYVAESRHAEHSAYQAEVAKVRSENCGLAHENKYLVTMIDDLKKQHEQELKDLVLKHDLEKDQSIKDSTGRASQDTKERDIALAEAKKLRGELESVRNESKALKEERDRVFERLQKELRGSEGLRKAKDSALAETGQARRGLKGLEKEKEGLLQDLKLKDARLASWQTKWDEQQKVLAAKQLELESEKAANEKARAELEKAESARTRSRKDLEASLSRLVESQRARAALQKEVSQGLEALAAEKKRHEELKEELVRSKDAIQILETEVAKARARDDSRNWVYAPDSDTKTTAEVTPESYEDKHVVDQAPLKREATTVPAPAQLGSGQLSSCPQKPLSSTVALPSFEVGTSKLSSGTKTNGRRKSLAAKRGGVKLDTDDVKLTGTQNELSATVLGFQASGRSIAAKQEGDTCLQKKGPEKRTDPKMNGSKYCEGILDGKASLIRTTMSVLQRQFLAGTCPIGEQAKPRCSRFRGFTSLRLKGPFRRKSLRRLTSELLWVVALMIKFEQQDFK